MTDHETRLTACNRRLVEDLNHAGQRNAALEAFVRRLLHPEDFGYAVSEEVLEEARKVLG
jgi:hypothetical protein